MKPLIEQFRKEEWSPYAAGALLGVVGILAVALGQHTIGVSGAFARMASGLAQAFAPTAMYFKYVMPPELTFEVALLPGIFLGGLLGALSSGTLRLRWDDNALWRKVVGPQRWKRGLLAFAGAIIVQFAAGIAGGCTSGLAISGGMLLVPAAFVFIAGMFVSGIVTAMLIYGRRY